MQTIPGRRFIMLAFLVFSVWRWNRWLAGATIALFAIVDGAFFASNIAKVADGVVVGSALVDLVAQHGADAAGPVRELTAALSAAVHSARKGAL